MAEERRVKEDNYYEGFNYMSDEDFDKRVSNLNNVLGTNPEAMADLADIISDIRNVRTELGQRTTDADNLRGIVEDLQQTNLQLMRDRMTTPRSVAREAESVRAENSMRYRNGEFAPTRDNRYSGRNYYGDRGNYSPYYNNGFLSESPNGGTAYGYTDDGPTGIDDLITDLIDENGGV